MANKFAAVYLVTTVLSFGLIAATVSNASAQGQEEMNEAVGHLREAKGSLEHASHNKGGHRENAIHLIDQAISEVEAGKAFAKEHPEKHGDHDHDHDHD